jgi:restriction modification system DNA specificity domain protein
MSRVPRIRFKGFEEDWEQRKFDEVFDCTIPNNTLSRAELNYDSGSVRNVHYGDILIKYGSVVDVQNDEIPFATGKSSDDFKDALLQDGDIIIADTAEDETTGKACEIGNLQGVDVVSGLHTMVCRPRKKMALGYLGYYLNSDAYHHQLLPLMQGIKVLSLSKTNVQKTIVYYPKNKAEQELIAGSFRNLDNLITLHQSKSFWYILKSIVSCTLYWEQRKLGEMCQITMGQSPDGSTYSETPSDFILVQGNADLKDGWIFPRIWTTQKTKTADAGDLIMSVRAPAGAMGKTAYNVVLGRGVAGIKGNEFIYQSLVNMDSDGYWKKLAAGSTFESINSDVVNGAELIIPQDIEEQIQIGSFFANLDHLITLHQLEPYNLIFKAIAYRIIDYAKSKPPRCIK